MTYCKIDVNNCSSSFLLSALAHFCSRLVLIFVPGSCSILLSARAHFCSRLVLIFVLGSCSFLFSARAHFCSATTARTHFRSPTVARTRDLPGHRTILLSARAHFCSRLVLIFVLGSCSLLLGNHRSYPFSLSNRCSYARPTGRPILGQS